MTTISAATCTPWCRTPTDAGDGMCASNLISIGPNQATWVSHTAAWNSTTGADAYRLVIDPDRAGEKSIQLGLTAEQAEQVAAVCNRPGTKVA